MDENKAAEGEKKTAAGGKEPMAGGGEPAAGTMSEDENGAAAEAVSGGACACKEESRAKMQKNGMAMIRDMESQTMTPAMGQYLEIKREHPEYLLFYRMGDFYELFFEDAVTVSGALGLTLTSRSRSASGKEIPMCGVPFHAYEIYLARLIKLGYKVAICEQTEDPKEAKKRGYKSIVKREVVRLVTPGTLTEDTLLDAKRDNFIACAYVRGADIGLAWLDISTGAFFLQTLKAGNVPAHAVLATALARLDPSEVLISDRLLELPDFFGLFSEYRERLSVWPKARFNLESALATLLKAYQVKSLDVFGDFSKPETVAAGTLFEYVENTQKGRLPRIEAPRRVYENEIMEIDASTRKSLELLNPSAAGGVSLLRVMDRTVTGVGGRLLAERLAAPSLGRGVFFCGQSRSAARSARGAQALSGHETGGAAAEPGARRAERPVRSGSDAESDSGAQRRGAQFPALPDRQRLQPAAAGAGQTCQQLF